MKLKLADLNITELENVAIEYGQPKFRGAQMLRWVGRGAVSFDDMTDLPKSFREEMSENYETGIPAIINKLHSKRDDTVKYVFATFDGNVIEGVQMRYKHGVTACISSQAGCRMGCRFCASKPPGFSRNLSSGEMLGQVVAINRDLRVAAPASAAPANITAVVAAPASAAHTDITSIGAAPGSAAPANITAVVAAPASAAHTDITSVGVAPASAAPANITAVVAAPAANVPGRQISNIVVMGIGEPFDNYSNCLGFIKLLHENPEIGIGYRKVTISTCGVLPGIERLADEGLPIGLSVSLNAPNDEIRNTLMPVNKKYCIDELLDVCSIYTKKTGRRVTFEYAMIDGVNDKDVHAREIAVKLRKILCHVNLIPINRVEGSGFRPSDRTRIDRFEGILRNGGVNVTVRRVLGTDIMAACGQLRLLQK